MKFEQQNKKYTDSGGKLRSLWVWPTDGWSTGSTGPIPPSHPSPTAKIYQTPRGSPQRTVVEQKTGVQHFSSLPFCAGTGHNGLPSKLLRIHSAATTNVLERSKIIQGHLREKLVKISTKTERPVPLFFGRWLRLMENIRQN
jgi:hypothetical protein